MDIIIYTKRYPLKERIAEVQKSKNKIINQREWEQFIQAAIDFSELYEQGIEITENRPFLWIELFLTDHFFVDEGKVVGDVVCKCQSCGFGAKKK